jgi:DNA polymerase-3 subunit alpha
MKAEFAHLPEAITTTMTIAERCNVDLNLGKIHLPKYFLEKGQDAMALLRQQAVEGLDAQLPSSRPGGGDYRKRLDAELKTIEQLGLADYLARVAAQQVRVSLPTLWGLPELILSNTISCLSV